jgi:hypothetical protein
MHTLVILDGEAPTPDFDDLLKQPSMFIFKIPECGGFQFCAFSSGSTFS